MQSKCRSCHEKKSPYYSLLSLFYPSQACAIEDLDQNNLIITGGLDGGVTNKVTKYNSKGEATDLPTLNNARYNHERYNQKVRYR